VAFLCSVHVGPDCPELYTKFKLKPIFFCKPDVWHVPNQQYQNVVIFNFNRSLFLQVSHELLQPGL